MIGLLNALYAATLDPVWTPLGGGLQRMHDRFGELGPNPTVDDLTVSFTSHLVEAIDRIFPLKTVKCHPSDKPWITPAIKKLIKDRQKAFHNHNIPLWRSLRHKVQHVITERKKSFYKIKAQHLRKNDCRKWWKIINKISGKSEKTKTFSLERDGKILNDLQLSNALNELMNSTPLLMLIFPHLMCIHYPRFYRPTTTYPSSNLMRSVRIF